jgi:hypothetical protein
MLVTSLLLAAGLAMFATTAIAEEKTHSGLVVSTGVGQLVMTDKDGKNEHTHIIGPTVKVSLDGKDSKLADLIKGDMVLVTTGSLGQVTAIAATRAVKR